MALISWEIEKICLYQKYSTISKIMSLDEWVKLRYNAIANIN